MGELQCAVIAWASACRERGMGIIASKNKTAYYRRNTEKIKHELGG